MTNIYHKYVLISSRKVNAKSTANLNENTKKEDEKQNKITKNKKFKHSKNQ